MKIDPRTVCLTLTLFLINSVTREKIMINGSSFSTIKNKISSAKFKIQTLEALNQQKSILSYQLGNLFVSRIKQASIESHNFIRIYTNQHVLKLIKKCLSKQKRSIKLNARHWSQHFSKNINACIALWLSSWSKH